MDGMQSGQQHELPKPVMGSGEVGFGFGKEEFGHLAPELKVAPTPGESITKASNAAAQAASSAQVALPDITSLTDATTGMPTAIAEDTDVMEKEWIDKAKVIVGSTKGDPHRLSSGLNDLKGDYLRGRFNKQLPSSKEVTT